jgi:hypothetical protein
MMRDPMLLAQRHAGVGVRQLCEGALSHTEYGAIIEQYFSLSP